MVWPQKWLPSAFENVPLTLAQMRHLQLDCNALSRHQACLKHRHHLALLAQVQFRLHHQAVLELPDFRFGSPQVVHAQFSIFLWRWVRAKWWDCCSWGGSWGERWETRQSETRKRAKPMISITNQRGGKPPDNSGGEKLVVVVRINDVGWGKREF